jgi:hypothetical protein
MTAFRQFCEDKQPPKLSTHTVGYIKHCLRKATQHAAMLGEEPDICHHQTFALMAVETGHPELIAEFLMAVPQGQAQDQAGA